jgi:hypothetical protein
MTASTPGNVGEGPAPVDSTPEGFTPLTVEEARALMMEAVGVDRDTLLAERAEAQLRAAEATLGISRPPANGRPDGEGGAEQEPDEGAQNRKDVDRHDGVDGEFDVEALRRAATLARAADDELARAASEATVRLPDEARLGPAESAFARALELQDELPAAWRRLVGALISATGMAIVVGALGWSVYWLLVPIALIAILTVDLRVAGKAAREASAEAAQELAAVGITGADGLERIRRQRTTTEETESRLAAARAERDAAYARFEELAPGRRPSEVEEIVAEHEAERTARAEAAAAARAEAAATTAGERPPVEAKTEAASVTPEAPEPALPTVAPVIEAPPTASEWWFGSKEAPPAPAAASAPVRALAERLSAEGREALARIEAQLAALDRLELAKRSLEWHEANGSAGDSARAEGASEQPSS